MQDEKLLKDYSKLILIHFLNTIFILYYISHNMHVHVCVYNLPIEVFTNCA